MNAIVILLFIISLIYVIFMIMAYSHSNDKIAAISPWWCFYLDTYDEYGKKLCKKGMILAVITIFLAVYEYGLKS